jgi:hypothetical protein
MSKFGCCDEVDIGVFKNHICIPNEGNPQYYDLKIVYCKKCGSLKSTSNINHFKGK